MRLSVPLSESRLPYVTPKSTGVLSIGREKSKSNGHKLGVK